MEKTTESETYNLTVASKVRAYIKDQGCMISPEAIDEFSRKAEELLRKAVERTKSNKRTTVRPYDF